MKEKIIKIMSEVFEVPESEFPEIIKQEDIDNWDSIRHLNLVVELEEAFDKTFEPEQIAEMTSLDKIVSIINEN